MSVAKIQKGDNVVITTGMFKGHQGVVTKVVKILRRNGLIQTKVSVSEVKQLVDYKKSNRQYDVPGQKGLKDRLIDASNVSMVDEKGKITKVKIELDDNGKNLEFLNLLVKKLCVRILEKRGIEI
ncbi:50S ribosomal protein L24 [Candidatus Gracilibacteria bacterium]|nr:50S ribosomal protein L24 [Candidatus Gracilibacteria bacterium]